MGEHCQQRERNPSRRLALKPVDPYQKAAQRLGISDCSSMDADRTNKCIPQGVGWVTLGNATDN